MAADRFAYADPFGDLTLDITPENPTVVIPAGEDLFGSFLEPQPHGGTLQRRAHLSDAEPDSSQFPWPPKLCLDLALGYDDEDTILLRHNIDSETYERIKKLPAFRRDLAMAMTSIREEGLTFKAKCRIFSEEYLDSIYGQLGDPTLSASLRFDMFKHLVKLGGLEPKEDKNTNNFDHLPRVAISINL